MRFCYFNHFPYRNLMYRPAVWPYPSHLADRNATASQICEYLDQASLADSVGFDWIAFGEEHSTPFGMVPNVSLAAAAVIARTRNSKIALLGAPIPLLNPLRVAEEIAWLDSASKGRIIVGLLRGVPQSYAQYGVDPDESWDRFEEAVAVILKSLSEDKPFSWKSHYYKFDDVSIWPRCFQTPHPPIIFSGGSARSLALAARYGAGVAFTHLVKKSSLQEARTQFALHERHSAIRAPRFLGVYGFISNTETDARRILEGGLSYMTNYLSGSFDERKREILSRTRYSTGMLPSTAPTNRFRDSLTLSERIEARLVVCGTPEQVRSQIEAIASETTVDVLSVHFQVGNIPHDLVCNAITLFGREVIPFFRGG